VAEETERELELIKEIKRLKDEGVETLQTELNKLKDALALYESLKDSADKRRAVAAASRDLKKAELDIAMASVVNAESLTAAERDRIEVAQKNLEISEKQAAAAERTTKSIRDSVGAADDLGASLSKAFAQYGVHPFFNATTIKNLGKAIFSLKDGLTGLATFGFSLVSGVLSNITDSFINLIFQLDETQSAFLRATGAGDEYATQISDVYERTREYGVELKELGKTMEDLYTTYTDFTMISGEYQEDLEETGALLNELGVSTKDYAQGLQVSTKMFGLGATEAGANARELASLAKEIGVTPAKMGADFAAAGAGIAKLGSEGVRAFKDLAIVSKTTGLEINKLLAITDKFDTFEGAATQAGKLNAALGGNFVNAMDLMMATDPVERFEMIRDSILDTGLTFDDMSYYQRNFYKETLGLSDVGDLALALSGDMSVLAGAGRKNTADYKKLRDETERVQSITESFRTIMMGLIDVVQPLIKEIQTWVQTLKDDDEAMERARGHVKTFTDALVSLGRGLVWLSAHWGKLLIGFTALGLVMEFITGKGFFAKLGQFFMSLLPKAFQRTAKASDGVADAISKIGKAAGENAKGIAVLSGAIVAIGLSIAIAAYGISFMVASFKGLGEAAWPAAAAVVGLGMAFVGIIGMLAVFGATVGAAAAGPLAILAGVMLAIGISIGVAAAGLGFMAEKMSGLMMTMDPTKMLLFTGFLMVAGTFGLLLGPAAVAMTAFTGAMGLFALALKFFPTDELSSFTKFFASLAAVGVVATDLQLVAAAIGDINKQIEGLPDKSVELTATMNSVVAARAAAGAAAPTIPAAATPAAGAAGGAAGGPERPYKVQMELKLDGEKIGEKFFTLMAGKLFEEVAGV